MGILNVTPDSFSDGRLYLNLDLAISKGMEIMEAGADLVDIGGESTRPGASPVELGEELRRTIPLVDALARRGVAVSIDTMKAEVARQALDAGAIVVNDVSALRDPLMRNLIQSRGTMVCVMHMQGNPTTMQNEPTYENVVEEVRDFLLGVAHTLDLPKDHVWIDPGIGFGKTLDHNLNLIRNLDALVESGYPVLIGVSRKGFIGKLLGGLPIEDRLEGTLALQTLAQWKGVRIIRAHDVKAAARTIRIVSALQNGFREA